VKVDKTPIDNVASVAVEITNLGELTNKCYQCIRVVFYFCHFDSAGGLRVQGALDTVCL